MPESTDPELNHLFSRTARWSSWVATRLAWLALWLIVVTSPALIFIALIVWAWALPLLGLAIGAAIYGRRALRRLDGPAGEGDDRGSAPEATRTRSGLPAVFAYALGIGAWVGLAVLLSQVGGRLGPPTRDLIKWLYTWQWWVTALVVVGVAWVVLLAYRAQSAPRAWGAVVARSGLGMMVSAGVLGLLVLCLGVGYSRGVGKLRWGVCYRNLLSANMALQMYLADYDDVFPPAETWTDLMLPYVGSKEVLVCPEAPEASCGLALNAALAGRRMAFEEPTRHVITLLESDRGWNGAGGREALPTVPRHGNGDNYGLLDGSCTWAARRPIGKDAHGFTVYDADTSEEWLRWDIASALEGWPPEERAKYGVPAPEPGG